MQHSNKSEFELSSYTSHDFSYDMVPQLNREQTQSPVDNRPNFTRRIREKLISTPQKRQESPQFSEKSHSTINQLPANHQEMILRTVSLIKKEDSEDVLETLDSSRQLLRGSFDEFKREQEAFRQELEEITKLKEASIKRPKENMIPLSVLLRKKQDYHISADRRSTSTMNPTYQVYFEALLSEGCNREQHPTDRAAVAKYIRRRERRKRAEENKVNHTISNDRLEQRTAELIQNMEGVDLRLEHERQRNNEIIRSKMTEKKIKTNNIIQATEIIGQASEADLARQRVEQAQREKVEARLSAIRQQNRSPSNLIHVRALDDPEDQTESQSQNEEEKTVSKQSIELLNQQSGFGSRPTTASKVNDQLTVTDIEI